MEGNVEFSSEAGRVPHPHTGVTERANRRNRIGGQMSRRICSV